MKKFSLVIPVFQSPNILRLFLDSLGSTLEFSSQIIFIDDACEKESREMLFNFKSKFKEHEIIIISHDKCKGCVQNINEAFDLLQGKYTVMLDSDIILNERWQTMILESFANTENTGAIGAKLIYPQSGGIQNCGLAFSECMIKHLYFLCYNNHANESEKIIKVQSTVFAFCAIPTKIIHEIGKLDESFFNGNEDVDYQLRIGEHGYNIYINPNIEVWHWEKSNGIHRKFNQRNNLCNIWKKHAHFIKSDLFEFIIQKLNCYLSAQEMCIMVDFSESRIDSKKLESIFNKYFSLLCTIDFSYCCNASNSIWLPELLYGEHICSKQRYLFLCDTFIQFCENSYWYNLRRKYREDDIIIDLNGNVLLLKDLEKTFWPYRKYR